MKKLCLILFCLFFVLTSFAPVHPDMTWMAIGDSITYLDGHPGEGDNRTTDGYMARVARKLPYISYVNHGHNGWTTARMASGIENEGIVKADIYTIFLGTNDWWSGAPLGTIDDYKNATGNKTMYGAYRTIINKIRSLNPDAKIVVMTPLQRGDFVYYRKFTNNAWGSYKPNKNGQMLSEYADAVEAIAELENFKLVDLYNKSGIKPKNAVHFKRLKDPQTGEYKNYKYPEYTTITFHPDSDKYPYPLEAVKMTYDGLHPSDKGLQRIADMLVKVMKKF